MARTRLYSIIVLASLAGYVWIAYLHAHGCNAHEPGACMIKSMTSIPCPSCGSSRSVMLILDGSFLAALRMNPFGFLISILLLVCPPWIIADVILKRNSFFHFYHTLEAFIRIKWVSIMMIILIAANWIWNIMKGI